MNTTTIITPLPTTPTEHKPLHTIGVYDSGIGGLTVFKELLNLPVAHYLYLADLGYLPYGDKTPTQLTQRTQKIISFFEQHKVDLIIAACYSSSAHLPAHTSTPVISMTNLTAQAAVQRTRNGVIGVIATQATVNRKANSTAINAINSSLTVIEQACPLLVPLIEAPEVDKPLLMATLNNYLQPLRAQNIDTLILGCTHYILLKKELEELLGPAVTIISAADLIHPLIAPHVQPASTTAISWFVTAPEEQAFYAKANRLISLDVQTKIQAITL